MRRKVLFVRNDRIVIDYVGCHRSAACRILNCGFLIVIGASIQVDVIEYDEFLTAVLIEVHRTIAEACQQCRYTEKIYDPLGHHGIS